MDNKKLQRPIYLEKETLNQLDYYAKKIKISRNKLMENLIESGLDDLSIMEKSGVLLIGVGLKDLLFKLRKRDIQSEMTF